MNIKKEISLNLNTQIECIFIANSAKFDVPKNENFNKRSKNSYQIFLILYKNICLIITCNIH